MSEQEYPAMSNGFDLNKPTIVALLHLLSAVTGGIFGVVAVVLAYGWRDANNQPAWARSHERYHIRTFWYSILFSVIGWLTWWVFGLGFVILALIGVLVAIRSLLALLAAQRHDPIPNPQALIW
jgi:uncharacterized membrane protein